MSPSAVLKKVKERFPELKELPKAKLRLVEEAVKYASEISLLSELASDDEHAALMKKLGPITPGRSLRAYRYREELNQSELAKKSGIPQANISAMENGKRPIGLNIAKRLAEILNCNYKRLI